LESDFILASASPRRYDLLNRLGLKFDVIPADVDEDYINGESPEEHVIRLSEKKAAKVSSDHASRWVLGADTIVVYGGEVLGKPKDKAGAKRMLGMLSGNVHEVYTGFCLKNLSLEKSEADFVVSKVKIKDISDEEAEFYTNTDEPYDKAGGYAVQGIGAFMVEEIIGSYTNVVGLPLSQVVEKLERMGSIRLF
jgi:septum formation protein